MAARSIDRAAVRRLRAPLLRWYRRVARDLPWRRTTDPYAIWVSEVMLQQTTVAAVVPYWERFLRRFPDVASLSRAGEEEVLALWTGLGYYQRARALRRGAIAVMEHHAGQVPQDAEALLALPGIGRYTAGAIGSVAFGRETPVVDGNVKRVLARLFALRARGDAAAERTYWAIATQLVQGASPGDLNQAVMELGATVCTPRTPRCDACPLAAMCRGLSRGVPESFPKPATRKQVRKRAVAAGWIRRGHRVLLERRRDDGPFRGAWDLPAVEIARGQTAADAIAQALHARYGLRFADGVVVAHVTHAILDTRLTIHVLEGTPVGRPRSAWLRWAEVAALGDVATSSATTKIAAAVAAQKRSQLSRGTGSSSGSSGRANA